MKKLISDIYARIEDQTKLNESIVNELVEVSIINNVNVVVTDHVVDFIEKGTGNKLASVHQGFTRVCMEY